MTQLSTASAFLAQVAGCSLLAILLGVAAWRFRRSWLAAWTAVFALAAVGVWSASLYFAGRGRLLVAAYSVLVVAASVLLLWGLLRFIDSVEWSAHTTRWAAPLLAAVTLAAVLLPPLTWFTVLSVIQALFLALTGAIVVASVAPETGRGLLIVGCLVQIGSHLFYLSSQVAGLGYTELYRYGLTADLVAELLIGSGLLLLALDRERPRAPASADADRTAVPPDSLEEWLDGWDGRDPAAIMAVSLAPQPSTGEIHARHFTAVREALEDLTTPHGLVVSEGANNLTAVVTAACLRKQRALEQLIRVARLSGESSNTDTTQGPLFRYGISMVQRRELAEEAVRVARRRMAGDSTTPLGDTA